MFDRAKSVGETPNLSAKSSFNNPSLKHINVSKKLIILIQFLRGIKSLMPDFATEVFCMLVSLPINQIR